MYFVLSKTVGVLLAPLSMVFILLFAGLILCYVQWQKAGRAFVVAAAVLLLLCGVLPLGHNMMVALEQRFPPPVAMPAHVSGILVLGGAVDTQVSAARGRVALNGAAERLWAATVLERMYPQALLVYSGGNNALMDNSAGAESVYAEILLQDLGMDTRDVLFENTSRNTFENIVNAMAMAKPQGNQTWVVVTSAWHMPRASDLVQSLGWPGTVIYWPVDYRTDGRIRMLPTDFNVLRNMTLTSVALHEWWGWLIYRLSGRVLPQDERWGQD